MTEWRVTHAQRMAALDQWAAWLEGVERETMTLGAYEAMLRALPSDLLGLQLVLVAKQLRAGEPYVALCREVARRVREQG